MDVHVFPDAGAATNAAADLVARLLTAARAVMLPGGNSPLRLYGELVTRRIDLAETEFFVLDEYLGVPDSDPRTCSNLIWRTFGEPAQVDRERFHRLPSDPRPAPAAIAAHERAIAAVGGLDLVILGLGVNGHLGFNEPGSAPDSPGRVVELAPTSVAANRAWFGGDYAPDRGVTTGLATVFAARRVVLLAFGPAKAAAVSRMQSPSPGLDSPPSWLQQHRMCDAFLDEAAAAAS